MFLDVAKPIALLLSILSLYASFHVAFLIPSMTYYRRIHDGMILLLLAAGISILGGLLFRESSLTVHNDRDKIGLMATLPVQLFCWTASLIILLFGVAWYLETYVIFYRNVYY
jgi:hypothetical protein